MHPSRLVIPALLLLSGCATLEVGREFNLPAFDAKVQRGSTTQEEVQAWLGAPAGRGVAVEADGERFEQWTYYHGEGRFPRVSNPQLSVLQIKFDQRGVVHAYNWSGEGK